MPIGRFPALGTSRTAKPTPPAYVPEALLNSVYHGYRVLPDGRGRWEIRNVAGHRLRRNLASENAAWKELEDIVNDNDHGCP